MLPFLPIYLQSYQLYYDLLIEMWCCPSYASLDVILILAGCFAQTWFRILFAEMHEHFKPVLSRRKMATHGSMTVSCFKGKHVKHF